MKTVTSNTASALAMTGLLLVGSIILNPSACRAGPPAVFRSGPRPAKSRKFSASHWALHEVYSGPSEGDLASLSPGFMADRALVEELRAAQGIGPPVRPMPQAEIAINDDQRAQGWALRMRESRAAPLWEYAAGNRRFPATWRYFAAYQLLMASLRPGETMADVASLCDGCPWLRRQMLRLAKVPLSVGGNTTAFSIRLASPGEPHGRLLIALAGKHSLWSVYQQLRGRQHTAAMSERATAIGVQVEGPEFKIPGLPQATRTFWLTAPVAPGGRPVLGQTLPGWALGNYTSLIVKASARRTAVVAALSVSEMPPDFWAALARCHSLAPENRWLAVQLFLVTGIKPGERLGELEHAMHGFPPWHRWQVSRVIGIAGFFPYYHQLPSVPGGSTWYCLCPVSARRPHTETSFPISLLHNLKRAQLVSCLNGRGRASLQSDIIVNLAPQWKEYSKRYILSAVKAARKLKK